MTTPTSANHAGTRDERRDDVIDAVRAVAAVLRGIPVQAVDHRATAEFTDRLLAIDRESINLMAEQFAAEARFRYSARLHAPPPGKRSCECAAKAEAEVARLRALLESARTALEEHVCSAVYGTVTGSSRRLTLEWSPIRPGVQGRLLWFGGGDDPHAWIDTRAETNR